MALSKKLTVMDEHISMDPLYLAKVSLFICFHCRIVVEFDNSLINQTDVHFI